MIIFATLQPMLASIIEAIKVYSIIIIVLLFFFIFRYTFNTHSYVNVVPIEIN